MCVCVGNWGADVRLFAKIHRKQQDHWHWCQAGGALVETTNQGIHNKVPLSGAHKPANPWNKPLEPMEPTASGWQLASNLSFAPPCQLEVSKSAHWEPHGKTYHHKPVAVHLAFWLLWPHTTKTARIKMNRSKNTCGWKCEKLRCYEIQWDCVSIVQPSSFINQTLCWYDSIGCTS